MGEVSDKEVTQSSHGPTAVGWRANTRTEIQGSQMFSGQKAWQSAYALLVVVSKHVTGTFVSLHVAISLDVHFWEFNS